MTTFSGIEFRYPFRDYQQRVLDSLEGKMNDNRIHVVAAPGSGKTVLGLEIIKRLDQPVLILVPSISLRNQWKERFLTLFVKDKDRENWESKISESLDNPGIITIVTYQALHAKCQENEKFQAFTKIFCLDEAHHLKKEWWKSLESFCLGNKDNIIISLTATPPYDSNDVEWARYNELCGEIDTEIFIPEMVQKHCLCPHQDYVMLCEPTAEELAKVQTEMLTNQQNQEKILKSDELGRQIARLQSLKNIKENGRIFVEEPEYLLALLSYIKFYWLENISFSDEVELRKEFEQLVASEEIPPMKDEYFEALMRGILDYDSESFDEEYREKLRSELIKSHFLFNNRFTIGKLKENQEKILKNTVSKLTAVEDIVAHESAAMGEKLRCLVLVDHIRKEDLSKVETNEKITDMGCVPVFEKLRRLEHNGNLQGFFENKNVSVTRIGVLTGGMVILPEKAMDKLQEMTGLEAKTLGNSGNSGYRIALPTEGAGKTVVEAVTKLFEDGYLQILIGTAALLGEGWDAPCVNSVIIASTVCTFVQSNQMRGRGLRLDPKDPKKVANIWHLTSYTKEDLSEYRRLCKRFDTITGISFDGKRIENGVARIELNKNGTDDVAAYRNRTLQLSSNRARTYELWEKCIVQLGDLSKVRDVVYAPVKKSIIFAGKRGRIADIGRGYLKTLRAMKLISDKVELVEDKSDKNNFGLYLIHADSKENALFTAGMQQMLAPVQKSRYIIERKPILGKMEYYAVPDIVSKKKEDAQLFYENVRKSGPFVNMKLIYTRNDEGTRLLLKLRLEQIKATKAETRVIRRIM